MLKAIVYYVLNGVVEHTEVQYNAGEDPVEVFKTMEGTCWDAGTEPDLHPPTPPHREH